MSAPVVDPTAELVAEAGTQTLITAVPAATEEKTETKDVVADEKDESEGEKEETPEEDKSAAAEE